MARHDISVLLSTYNRADMLRQTLEAMSELDLSGLHVEFVVVDNNSKDDTAEVIDSFSDRLPLNHLFEPRPGKNCALNHALDHAELGTIVVFTDDDIVPREDWLQKVAASCERWTEYSVFGGKIEPIWPEGVEIPQWAQENRALRTVLFGALDLGDEDLDFGDGLPFGGNLWVRSSVFDNGRRYDESIGPRPGSYKMGSETSLLMALVEDGLNALYVHDSSVGHHVQPVLLSEKAVVARFVRQGRMFILLQGIKRSDLLARSVLLWCARTICAIALLNLRLWRAHLIVTPGKRIQYKADCASYLGHYQESFREVWRDRA